MTIIDFLENNSRTHGEEVALVEINPLKKPEKYVTWKEYSLIEPGLSNEYRREITWARFDDISNRFANMLLSRGVKKGDKVAILLMNSLEWLPIYFGILKTGALAVPLNYRYTQDEIKYCLDLAECSYLIFGVEFIGRIEAIFDVIPNIKYLIFVGENTPSFAESFDRQIDYYSNNKPNIELDLDDDAAIYFSSGTTGFPKAILHAHKALYNSAIIEQNHHRQKHGDCFLCIPPLYHTGAKMHWFGSLVSCSKAVLLKGVKPEWILETVSLEKCTNVWLLVPWVQDILDSLERGDIKLEDYETSQWTLMHVGAQPVPPSLIRRWLKVFPNHMYDTNYGLSESIGPGCVHLGIENVEKVGSIGKAGFKWETKITDEKHNEITEPNKVGELAVKGPGVMKCYFNNEKATKEILEDDWLYTGDMAKYDEDGFIYLVDRKKDVIITGGENLYPVQIEDFLRANSKIKDVAVIGYPDDRLGEIACAIIEVKEGMTMTEDEVNEFSLGMPRYKRPRKIIFASVPRNPTGKIEKPKLREIYCGFNLVERETTK